MGLNRLNWNDNSSKKKNKFISVHDIYRVVLNFFEYLQQYVANSVYIYFFLFLDPHEGIYMEICTTNYNNFHGISVNTHARNFIFMFCLDDEIIREN